MLARSALITLALTASFGAVALAQGPNPGQVAIQTYNYSGTGCPNGTVEARLASDAQAFTLLFSSFLVDSSQNRGRQMKKNCAVNLSLAIPPGWTYTLFSVDYRGFILLDKDSNARLRSWYSLSTSPEQVRIANWKVDGPMQRDYENRAFVPLDTLPWLTCNAGSSTVVINTELMADGPQAMITADSADGELKQRYGIAWRPCSQSSSWRGNCQAVLETHWGTDLNRFYGSGTGVDHPAAKNAARSNALDQCQHARSQLRPLVQAGTRCVVDEPLCVATPQ